MQHFQLILIILGACAILAVLIHGYIVSRKDRLSAAEQSTDVLESSPPKSESNKKMHQFTDLPKVKPNADKQQENDDFLFASPQETDDEINFSPELSYPQTEHDDLAKTIRFDDGEDLSRDPQVDTFAAADSTDSDSQMTNEQIKAAPDNTGQAIPVQQDYFVFNVAAKEGQSVRGHELLQFFLTAGFRFGEMSIFHRHEHSDGTGPILFSIANMMKPGIFNLDKMEQFRSEGVSFFLTAPNDQINIKKAFDMMLVAVEQMAEEFDCVVLNENREPLTKKEFISYHERLLRYI